MSREAPTQAIGASGTGSLRLREQLAARPLALTVRRLALRLGGILGLLVVWQAATVLFEIPHFMLPQPINLARGIVNNWEMLFKALRVLLLEALGGFVLGNTTGVILAYLVSRSMTLRATLLPLALAIRSIPIVAITPLITIILGFGYITTVTVAAMICFFPTLVNVSRGLISAPIQAVQLFRLLDASEWKTFWKLSFPSALPFLFTALRITGPASIIGAMVAEFIASDAGLGFLILLSYSSYRFDIMWQAIVVTTLCSVFVFVLVGWIERLVIPWYHAQLKTGS
jgi:NitT/TauT family transport system permease protein